MPGQKLCRIEIAKQAINFSSGHFTIFNANEREDLHGHNFQVACHLTAPIGDDGLMFDYAIIKKALKELCDELDEQVLLPDRSPYLELGEKDGYITATFAGETMMFLPRDVTVLPVANTTVEEFSHFFLGKVVNHPAFADRGIIAVTVKVSSSPGQHGCAEWVAS